MPIDGENTLRTVFVIGAGGSVDLGFPTGDGLKSEISELIAFPAAGERTTKGGDENIWQAFSVLARERGENTVEKYVEAARRIRKALPLASSIDSLLHDHRDDVRMIETGKLAIARAISLSESRSPLNQHQKESRDFGPFVDQDQPWHLLLFKMLTHLREFALVKDVFSTVSLIIFNYDRNVEQFLFNALIWYYGCNSKEAATCIEQMDIIHPYGELGPLDWASQAKGFHYGKEPFGNDLLSTSRNIRTFTEGFDSHTEVKARMENAVKNAATIVFLGFGFLPLNMKALHPGEFDQRRGVSCYASTKDMSPPNTEEAKIRIEGLFGRTSCIEVQDATCDKFLSNFSMPLERKIATVAPPAGFD